MSFRGALGNGTRVWEIPLGTHLETKLANETTEPVLALAGTRAKAEQTFRTKFREAKPPVAGYNCFGAVFALRRTGIDPDLAMLETIVAEDGYGEVPDADIRIGDSVVYFDGTDPFHAATVIRFDPLLVGASTMVAIVVSKMDDVSGEYEHKIDEHVWPNFALTRKVYRPRMSTPQRRGWRGVVLAP